MPSHATLNWGAYHQNAIGGPLSGANRKNGSIQCGVSDLADQIGSCRTPAHMSYSVCATFRSRAGYPMADAGAGEKLKVFISYSRKDSAEFADELVAGLEYGGFAPFLDRHDIAAGEDWEARLGGLIVQSDTVVFVVSPEAVKSERCVWEVDRTIELSKRLLPVIFKSVPEHEIPKTLSRLQFVRFDTGRGITRPLAELAEALRQALDWIREHTRLGEIATRWDRRKRPEALLLRGDDLEAAKAWMAARKVGAPEITDAQRALISASEEAEARRLGNEREQLERDKAQVAEIKAAQAR